MTEHVERILEVLRPRKQQRAACTIHVENTVRAMRHLSKVQMHPEQLQDITKAADQLEMLAAKLPDGIPEKLRAGLDALKSTLKLYAHPVGAAKRHKIPQKRAAADYALDLLVRWYRQPPSLTREGPYLQITRILFEVFDAKEDVDLQPVCKQQLEALVGSMASYGRMKRAGKSASRRAPAYLLKVKAKSR